MSAAAQASQAASPSLSADLHAQLVHVDARLKELESQRSRNGIGLPISLTAGSSF